MSERSLLCRKFHLACAETLPQLVRQVQGFLNLAHKFVEEKAGGSWERPGEVYFWWMV